MLKRHISGVDSFTDLTAATITATVTSENEIAVSWAPAAGDLGGYVLTCESDSHTIQAPQTEELNSTCEGLLPGTEYTVYVATVKSNWLSVESSPVTATTSM